MTLQVNVLPCSHITAPLSWGPFMLQNKVSELENKVTEQNQRISQLLQDKASLESRCSILIRVVQMRNEQLEQMPQASAVS